MVELPPASRGQGLRWGEPRCPHCAEGAAEGAELLQRGAVRAKLCPRTCAGHAGSTVWGSAPQTPRLP